MRGPSQRLGHFPRVGDGVTDGLVPVDDGEAAEGIPDLEGTKQLPPSALGALGAIQQVLVVKHPGVPGGLAALGEVGKGLLDVVLRCELRLDDAHEARGPHLRLELPQGVCVLVSCGMRLVNT